MRWRPNLAARVALEKESTSFKIHFMKLFPLCVIKTLCLKFPQNVLLMSGEDTGSVEAGKAVQTVEVD